jgi:amidase
MPTSAFRHDHSLQPERRLDIVGRSVAYDDQIVWAAVAALTGFPATVIPIAHAGGLPVGVQIVGPYLHDRTTLAFAELIGREFGGVVPPPL